jgi:hypothetical protein
VRQCVLTEEFHSPSMRPRLKLIGWSCAQYIGVAVARLVPARLKLAQLGHQVLRELDGADAGLRHRGVHRHAVDVERQQWSRDGLGATAPHQLGTAAQAGL